MHIKNSAYGICMHCRCCCCYYYSQLPNCNALKWTIKTANMWATEKAKPIRRYNKNPFCISPFWGAKIQHKMVKTEFRSTHLQSGKLSKVFCIGMWVPGGGCWKCAVMSGRPWSGLCVVPCSYRWFNDEDLNRYWNDAAVATDYDRKWQCCVWNCNQQSKPLNRIRSASYAYLNKMKKWYGYAK